MVNERSPNSQWLPTERKPVIYQPNDRGYFGSLSHWAVNDQLPIYVDATNQSKSFSLQLLSMDLAHFKIHLNLHLPKATSL